MSNKWKDAILKSGDTMSFETKLEGKKARVVQRANGQAEVYYGNRLISTAKYYYTESGLKRHGAMVVYKHLGLEPVKRVSKDLKTSEPELPNIDKKPTDWWSNKGLDPTKDLTKEVPPEKPKVCKALIQLIGHPSIVAGILGDLSLPTDANDSVTINITLENNH